MRVLLLYIARFACWRCSARCALCFPIHLVVLPVACCALFAGQLAPFRLRHMRGDGYLGVPQLGESLFFVVALFGVTVISAAVCSNTKDLLQQAIPHAMQQAMYFCSNRSFSPGPSPKLVREPPKNGVIALWQNTRVVKCKNYVSQKQNAFNNTFHWYSILLTFIFKLRARLMSTKIYVLSNLGN